MGLLKVKLIIISTLPMAHKQHNNRLLLNQMAKTTNQQTNIKKKQLSFDVFSRSFFFFSSQPLRPLSSSIFGCRTAFFICSEEKVENGKTDDRDGERYPVINAETLINSGAVEARRKYQCRYNEAKSTAKTESESTDSCCQ